jgi:arylsulfatase/arylsulfatase A
MKILPILLLCLVSYCSIAQDRPNIIIMMTDDQGYGDLGLHGNPHLKTPNMESIANDGLEMTQFLSYPNCSATRAGLLTGRYPYRTGVVAVTQTDHFMNGSEVTLAEILKDNGYRTGIFGKWHLGDNHPMRATDQGFDEALVHKAGGIGQAAGPAGNTYFDPVLEHNDVSKKYKGYCDDIFTDAALDFIQKKSDKPFFTYLATNLPHFPLQVPDKLAQPYREKGLHEDNALTYGMIDSIDYNVGRVLDKLKALDIEDDTLVIFLSDNGPRNRRTKNDVYPGRWMANLRGTKTSVYDGGIRVPFFVKLPGKIKTKQTTKTMASMIDILPTILDLTDIPAPENVTIDGKSLLPLWVDGDDSALQDRTYFTQLHYGPEPFKYMHFAARTQSYKLISPHDYPHGIHLNRPTDEDLEKVLASLELYDVSKDVSERINLAAEKPEVVDKLLAQYEEWFYAVTEERDAKGLQKIYLGTKAQPSVSLSRFDWGGPRALYDYSNSLGHWQVTTETGKYNINVEMPALDEKAVAHFKYNGVHLTQDIKIGQTSLQFNNVKLNAGEGNFHVFFKTSKRLTSGPSFVDVSRVDM